MPIPVDLSPAACPSDRSELDLLLEFVDRLGGDFPDFAAGNNIAATPKEIVDADCQSSPTKPATRRGASESERLTKSREKERRRYYRNKNRLNSLRRTAASLERQLGSLTLIKQSSAAAPPPSLFADHCGVDTDYPRHSSGAVAGVDVAFGARPQELQARYAELLQLKTCLHDENEQLRRHLSESSRRVKLLSKRLFSEQATCLTSPTSFRLFDPLTAEMCASVNRRHAETADAVKRDLWPTVSLLEVSSGWNEKRVVADGVFRFTVSKRYKRASAADACGKVWELLSHPLCSRQLFPDVVSARVRLVQRVDGDNFVVLEEIESETGDGWLLRSLLLISRIATPAGARINISTLDKGQVVIDDVLADPSYPHDAAESEAWGTSEQFTWVEFEQLGDVCAVTCAGAMPVSGAKTRFWMAEAALVCLRAETAVLGSRFSLHA